MSALAPGLFQGIRQRGMIEPRGWPLLDVHGIAEQANHQAEWQDDDRVQQRQQHSRVKVADGVTELLPPTGELLSGSSRQAEPYGNSNCGHRQQAPPVLRDEMMRQHL